MSGGHVCTLSTWRCAATDGGKVWALLSPVMTCQLLMVMVTQGIMGRKLADGGLLRYRKWVPQQLGDVADRQPTNGSAAQRHGSQSHRFAVRVWSNLCICSPGLVELVKSNLAPDFPLFHVLAALQAVWWYLHRRHSHRSLARIPQPFENRAKMSKIVRLIKWIKKRSNTFLQKSPLPPVGAYLQV